MEWIAFAPNLINVNRTLYGKSRDDTLLYEKDLIHTQTWKVLMDSREQRFFQVIFQHWMALVTNKGEKVRKVHHDNEMEWQSCLCSSWKLSDKESLCQWSFWNHYLETYRDGRWHVTYWANSLRPVSFWKLINFTKSKKRFWVNDNAMADAGFLAGGGWRRELQTTFCQISLNVQ